MASDHAILRSAEERSTKGGPKVPLAFLYVLYAIAAADPVAAFALSLPREVQRRLTSVHGPAAQFGQDFGPPDPTLAVLSLTLMLVATASLAAIAGLIAWRKRRSRYSLFLSLALLIHSTFTFGVVRRVEDDPTWSWLVPISAALNYTTIYVALLTFPDGRFVPRWMLGVAAVWTAWFVLPVSLPAAGSPGLPRGPLGVGIIAGAFALAVAARVYRYAQRATDTERRQTRWLTLGIAIYVAAYAVSAAPTVIPALGEPSANKMFIQAYWILYPIAVMTVPVTMGLAIFRDRFLDINIVVSRGAAFAASALALVGILVALNVGAQRLAAALTGSTSDVLTAALALALLAVFEPLRRRVNVLTDHLLPPRGVVSILFIDVTDSTRLIAEIGDERWHEILSAYKVLVRRELKQHRGEEIDQAGDGFFATFSSADEAIRCASAIARGASGIGIQTRAGVHTGECRLRGEKPTGMNVHITARVMGEARPGEVVVSSAARESVTGTSMGFVDLGPHALKGVPGEIQLFAAGSGSR